MRSYLALNRISAELCLVGAVGCLVACQGDNLAPQIARLNVTPQPSPTQAALQDPVGIDCGKVPLAGLDEAVFGLENVSASPLEITKVEIKDTSHGEFEAVIRSGTQKAEIPLRLEVIGEPESAATLEVIYKPKGADGTLGSANIQLTVDVGSATPVDVPIRIQGKAHFVGEPNLEIQYGSSRYLLPEACAINAKTNACRLPDLSFGNVPFESEAYTNITLRNSPAPGTCRLPPLPDEGPDCRVACAVTFDRDPGFKNVGVGFNQEVGFGLIGSSAVPFILAPLSGDCPADPAQHMVRGEIKLTVEFAAGPPTDDDSERRTDMILESNDPGAPRIEIPLLGYPRKAPVAVAGLRLCSGQDQPPSCTESPEAIEPLSRVYFQGRGSHDPDGGTIEGYRWEIVDYPEGAKPGSGSDIYSPQGQGTELFAINLPLAGDYVVRLHVTNDLGVESGIGTHSDVAFTAVPASRLHLQLVWDHLQNDQDLHLVRVNESGQGLIYHAQNDCFWRNCKPACAAGPECASPQWDVADPVQEGSNPRLDRDDKFGRGPENINIDEPGPGRYQVFANYYGMESPIDDLTQVTVRVYIDGVLREESRKQLLRNQIWAVAEIVWHEDNSAQVVMPKAGVNPVQELFPLPGDEGWSFDPSPF